MKPWYQSRTLWVNLIVIIAILVQSQTSFVIEPEAQAALVVVINLILRAITKTGLTT